MKRKILAVGVVLIGTVITTFVNFAFFTSFGGPVYKFFPFPVKGTTCRFFSSSNVTCNHQYIWWGIIASVIFWIIILGVAYTVVNKRKTM